MIEKEAEKRPDLYPLVCNNPKCKSPNKFRITVEETVHLPACGYGHNRLFKHYYNIYFYTRYCPFCGKKTLLCKKCGKSNYFCSCIPFAQRMMIENYKKKYGNLPKKKLTIQI